MTRFIRTALLLPFLLSAICFSSLAQDGPQQEIFPELTGSELLDSLRGQYKPVSVLSYNNARDKMYGEIYVVQDSVYCVYTGDVLFMDPAPGQNPRTYAYENNPMWNTEHIYPQSMGAGSGNARSDLHHLRPIRGDVNAERGNNPFALLETGEVGQWWKGSHRQNTVPAGDLTLWSRSASGKFEVMDEYKGDVARAMFYFYTMYDQANSAFFNDQIDVLRQYHLIDSADSMEVARTHHIASYQNDKANPFVLDSTLVRRAFFAEGGSGSGGDNDDDGGGHDDDPEDEDDEFDTGDPTIFTATYNFEGTLDCNTQDDQALENHEFVSLSGFRRTGVQCNDGGGTFNSNNWSTDGQADPNAYVSFTVTAEETRYLKFTDEDSVTFSLQRSGTGPTDFLFDYIADDGSPTTLTAGTVPGSAATFEVAMPELDNITNVEFRIYGWNAGASTGTMRVNNLSLTGEVTERSPTRAETEPDVPAHVVLMQNYPNPFNPATQIGYELQAASDVHLAVYDMMGRELDVLVASRQSPGHYVVSWDASGYASGMYMYRLTSGNITYTRTMMLIK